MKKVNVSTKQINKYAGKWVVIDPQKNRIVAVGDELKEIGPLISRPASDKRPAGTVPAAFKVPYKDERYLAPSPIFVSKFDESQKRVILQ